MKQYRRQWEIRIDGKPFLTSQEFDNFRVVFDVEIFPSNSQAFADIRITNIKSTEEIAQGKSIQLLAGYVDSCDTIFTGNISNVFLERQGPNIITRMTCRGGTVVEGKRGTANSSYPPGVRIEEILNDMAKAWPLYPDFEVDQFKNYPPLSSGFVAQGDIPQILDSLKWQYGFEWSNSLGSLVINSADKPRKTTVFEINQENGMVGIPEVGRGPNGMGVNVTTRINPYLRINSQINVTARFSTYNTGDPFVIELPSDVSANGLFNVFSLRYEGDTHGDAWDIHIDGIRPESAPLPVTRQKGSLVWGAKVNEEFRKSVREMATRQGLDPNWYMAIMGFETGLSFLPSQANNAGGSARGLIQFMPETARELGTSSAELVLMTAPEQMKYVEKYFNRYRSRISSLADMYMAVLWPVATDWPIDKVIWERDGATARQYRANSGLDTNGDGKITKNEAYQRILKLLKDGEAHAA